MDDRSTWKWANDEIDRLRRDNAKLRADVNHIAAVLIVVSLLSVVGVVILTSVIR